MGQPPTLLDTQVTSDHPPDSITFHDWKASLNPAQYQRAAQVYSFIDSRDSTKRYERFRECRTTAWFARHRDTGHVRVLSNGCKLRWCPLCANGTRAYISGQVLDWIKHQPQPKFMTLTLRHSAAPLGHQVDSLYKYFRQLKKTGLWRKNVAGGIWFFQLKLSKADCLWHPHLHLLLNSSYIRQNLLSALWRKITKLSCIVDIRAVKDSRKAAEYVARYCSQSADLVPMPFNYAVDCVTELHGRRLCGTFGSARSYSLRISKPTDTHLWQNVGSWWTVTRSHQSDPNARDIWKAWREGLILDPNTTCSHTDQFFDGKTDEVPDLHVDYTWPDYDFGFF